MGEVEIGAKPVPPVTPSTTREAQARELALTRLLEDVMRLALALAQRRVGYDAGREIAQWLAIDVWRRRQADPDFLSDPEEIAPFVAEAVRLDVLNAVDAARRRKERHTEYGVQIQASVRAWMDPDASVAAKETERALEQALGRMPRRLRTVYLATRDDSVTYRDVAEAFGVTVNAVKKNVARAQAFLQLELADHRPPPPARRRSVP
jgi:RNA polymerase sigma factor (sigma-70 family)